MTLKEQVPARCYYCLLDFNDQDNWKLINELTGKIKLNELTEEEFWKLFQTAVKQDLETFN